MENRGHHAAQDALYLLGVNSMLHFDYLFLDIFAHVWQNSRAILSREEDTDICTPGLWHSSQLSTFIETEKSEWDDYRFIEAVSMLEDFSFVNRNSIEGAPHLSIHPLTHAWAKDRQDNFQKNKACIRL